MSTPDYYQFPHGIQPIHISRHLTSNGGQILQYVARSTRLDGNNKHDREGRKDDLRKLINLAYDEIDRLHEEAEDEVRNEASPYQSYIHKIISEAPPFPAEKARTITGPFESPIPAQPLDGENAYEEEVTYVTGGK